MHRTEDGAIVGSINVSELTEDEKAELGLNDETAAAGHIDWSGLTKAELVEKAQAAGISTSGLNKADIVAALEAGPDDDEAEPDDAEYYDEGEAT